MSLLIVALRKQIADVEEEEENELSDKIVIAHNLTEDVADVLIPDALEYYIDINDDILGGEHMEDEDLECERDDSDEDDKKKSQKCGDKKAESGAAGCEQKQECKL